MPELDELFQNISCLRLMNIERVIKSFKYGISKHFMFTVNFLFLASYPPSLYFKTFHVYG